MEVVRILHKVILLRVILRRDTLLRVILRRVILSKVILLRRACTPLNHNISNSRAVGLHLLKDVWQRCAAAVSATCCFEESLRDLCEPITEKLAGVDCSHSSGDGSLTKNYRIVPRRS